MVIILMDYIDDCKTNDQGQFIYNLIKAPLINGENVAISFKGFTSVSSSFLNSCLIELLQHISFSDIKKQLSFIDSNKHINESIIRRFRLEFEVEQPNY